MTLLYIAIGYLILLSLLVHMGTVKDYALKKGYEGIKAILIGFVPVYGYKYYRNIKSLRLLESGELEHLLSFNVLAKRVLVYGGLLLLTAIILTPISLLLYLSLTNNLLQTLFVIYAAIILLLMHQGTVVSYASKKGYVGKKPGLMGLIPIYGFIYYNRQEKLRNVSKQALKEVFKASNLVQKLLVYAQITFVAVVVIVPVVYIFGMAFSNLRTDIPNRIWPKEVSFEAFTFLFAETNFKLWYLNTLTIALINMIVGTLLITGAAYVFARFSFKGKKAGLLTILVLQAFPSFMGLIAMYVLFWKFGLLGQPRALSILYIGGSIPGSLWLVKGFLSQIPKDLDESAMIDGASKWQIFWKIILPLAVPILTFVAVGMFMAPWMDYLLPGFLLRFAPANAPGDYDITQQWTLAIGLFRFINDRDYLHYSAFAAGALLVGIPITAMYMAFQKYLIEGVMAGATKG